MDTVGIVGSKLKLTNHRLKSKEIEDLAPLHWQAFPGWMLHSGHVGRLTSGALMFNLCYMVGYIIVGPKLKLTNHRLKSEEIEDLAPLHWQGFPGWLLHSGNVGRLTSGALMFN
jgi:hypothetical protein